MIKQLEFAYLDPDESNNVTKSKAVSTDRNAAVTYTKGPPTNEQLADAVKEVASHLQVQGANRFRVEAYFRAVNVLQTLQQPVWEIYELNGIAGLEDLPAIGKSIARAIQQMVRGGRWALLERLNGNDSAESAFESVPNIGPAFAKRIHDELHIETLVELQSAAWDGRLERLSGVGEKRLATVRESLAGRGRFHYPLVADQDDHDVTGLIPVAEILDIDDQYLFEVRHKTLPQIAPKKNNPTREAWLPILHTERGERQLHGDVFEYSTCPRIGNEH